MTDVAALRAIRENWRTWMRGDDELHRRSSAPRAAPQRGDGGDRRRATAWGSFAAIACAAFVVVLTARAAGYADRCASLRRRAHRRLDRNDVVTFVDALMLL